MREAAFRLIPANRGSIVQQRYRRCSHAIDSTAFIVFSLLFFSGVSPDSVLREAIDHLPAILRHPTVPVLCAGRWHPKDSLSQATFSPPATPPASLQMELTLGWQGREIQRKLPLLISLDKG